MGEGGAQPVGRDRHHRVRAIAAALDQHRAGGELGRHSADDRLGVGQERRPWRGIGLELAEQMAHARDRVLDRLEHVPLEIGIVDIAPRVGYDQAELARQVLDVVDHEGEPFAVFGQQFGVAQPLGRAFLGEIAGGLAAGRAQQIERLPIETAGVPGTIEHDKADEFAAMRQRHRQPGPRRGEQPGLADRIGGALLNPAAVAKAGDERIVSRHPHPALGPDPP